MAEYPPHRPRVSDHLSMIPIKEDFVTVRQTCRILAARISFFAEQTKKYVMISAITIILPVAVFAAMWGAITVFLKSGRALVPVQGCHQKDITNFPLHEHAMNTSLGRSAGGGPEDREIQDLHHITNEEFEEFAEGLAEELMLIEEMKYQESRSVLPSFVRRLEDIIIESARYRPDREQLTRNRDLQVRIAELLTIRRRAMDEIFCDIQDRDEMNMLEEVNAMLRKVDGARTASLGVMDAVSSFVEGCHQGTSCTTGSAISTIPFSRDIIVLPADSAYESRFDIIIPLVTALDRRHFHKIHADRVAADFLLEPLEGMDLCHGVRELHYLLLSLPDIVRLTRYKVTSETTIIRKP